MSAGRERTSDAIAHSVKTNPVVVRKILKLLEHGGLVALRQGRHGGVSLRRATEAITLGDIYRAVDGDGGVFALRDAVNPRCVVARAVGTCLTDVYRAVDDAVERTFQQTTLAQVLGAVP